MLTGQYGSFKSRQRVLVSPNACRDVVKYFVVLVLTDMT